MSSLPSLDAFVDKFIIGLNERNDLWDCVADAVQHCADVKKEEYDVAFRRRDQAKMDEVDAILNVLNKMLDIIDREENRIIALVENISDRVAVMGRNF
jgi:hypothetical protein